MIAELITTIKEKNTDPEVELLLQHVEQLHTACNNLLYSDSRGQGVIFSEAIKTIEKLVEYHE